MFFNRSFRRILIPIHLQIRNSLNVSISQNEEDRSENMKYPLVIEDLRKSYPLQSGEVQNVVEVESFELNQGSQLAIQGASGTGKSTFLNSDRRYCETGFWSHSDGRD